MPGIYLTSPIRLTNTKAKINFSKFQITVVRFDPLHSLTRVKKQIYIGQQHNAPACNQEYCFPFKALIPKPTNIGKV